MGFNILALSFLLAVGIIGLQAVLWLADGYWTPLPLSILLFVLGIEVPSLEWKGFQKILHWTLDLPISGFVILAGIVIGSILMWIEGQIEKQKSIFGYFVPSPKRRRELGNRDDED